MKLDSMGCLEPECHLVDNLQENELSRPLDILIHPNPAQAGTDIQLHIRIPSNLNASEIQGIAMVDALGKSQAISYSIKESRLYLRHDILNAGLYLIQLSTRDGQVYTGKVLME